MKTTTFETAKVGNYVWDIQHGWGTVYAVNPNDDFPIKVTFDNFKERYRYSGQAWAWVGSSTLSQSLFWGEVVIEAPVKPMPDLNVDAKVLVWGNNNIKHRRHFSHFKNGQIFTFDSGSTSFTKLHDDSVTGWPNWELPE